ncbi:MAG: thiamine phosphate synthase [Lachnospiraceae bacterium]|nr:thiamine phosphate synthase [Lachnospiraceae bacterium]
MKKGKYNNIIAVTNRHLCSGDFLQKINELAGLDIDSIILREKDLSVIEYKELANKVLDICAKHNKTCILHNFWEIALELGCPDIHIPLDVFRKNVEKINESIKNGNFKRIGTSVHSVEDAKEAISYGATYLIAGHIFATDCKKDLEPRGLDFLKAVCSSVEVPVYAIGGINMDRMESVIQCGAKGGCIMSGFMRP